MTLVRCSSPVNHNYSILSTSVTHVRCSSPVNHNYAIPSTLALVPNNKIKENHEKADKIINRIIIRIKIKMWK